MEVNQIALILTLLLGVGVAAIGIFAMLNPKKAAAYYGVKAKDEGLTYVAAAGVRDLFIGLVFLILYLHKDSKLIAMTCVCVALVALADAILVLKRGAKRASRTHFVGMAYALLVAILFFL